MASKPFPRIKSKHRKYTREDLFKNLAIIGTISTPLPPDLPPSPPPSRSPSPELFPQASSSKRKLDAFVKVDSESFSKRQRLLEKPSKHHHTASSSSSVDSHKAGIRGSDYTDKSELVDEDLSSKQGVAASVSSLMSSLTKAVNEPHPVAPALASTAVHMPVRRPRRGKDIQFMDSQHDKWHSLGRAFKYSGDARFWSTFPASHKHFKPLQNPPPAGSPYHTHGGLMSRLELVDALICFVYSLWCKDYARGHCAVHSWRTIGQYLSWCKQKWTQENSISVREKTFVGLIHMIEAFIHQRKVQYAVMTRIESEMNQLVKRLPKPEDLAKAARAAAAAQSTLRATPGMLPSPANTLGSNSANSTPTNPSGGGTPPNLENRVGVNLGVGSQPPVPAALPGPPIPPPVPAEASVPQPLLWELKEIVEDQNAASYCMKIAQQHLSLATMREHFPRTFDRMIYSSLTAQEEHEPDLEDDEGELLWPGQCVTGEGLGWVCLMGSAMVKEFGKDFGYRGIEGIIPKP